MALNYGNYGIFLIVGHAGVISSTVPWVAGEATGTWTSRMGVSEIRGTLFGALIIRILLFRVLY